MYCDYGEEYDEAELAQYDDRPDLRPLNLTQAMEFGFLQVSGTNFVNNPEESPIMATQDNDSKFCERRLDGDEYGEGDQVRWFLKYSFDRPILFSGYNIRTANDFEQRDPASWAVYYKKLTNKKDKFKKIHFVEDGGLSDDRFVDQQFTFSQRNEVWTDTIVLEVYRTKDDGALFCQLAQFLILSDDDSLKSMTPARNMAGNKVINFGVTDNLKEIDHEQCCVSGFQRVEGTEAYNDGEGPWNATTRNWSKFGGPFNGDNFDEDAGRGGWEFTYYFKRPILVKGYIIQTANDCPNRDPVCW